MIAPEGWLGVCGPSFAERYLISSDAPVEPDVPRAISCGYICPRIQLCLGVLGHHITGYDGHQSNNSVRGKVRRLKDVKGGWPAPPLTSIGLSLVRRATSRPLGWMTLSPRKTLE